MRFSLNFIKEFLNVKCTAQELASALTASGMEVENLEKCADDWIFDIEVTTNRYDWLSLVGIAREASAVLHEKFTLKLPEEGKRVLLKEKRVIIQDKGDCPYYIGRLIKNVTVGEAPEEIKQRIINCGINSINNAVDITNYCMLKWGNPLHVFDNDKIKGDVYIRRAKSGEKFIGIDEKMRILDKENLVIADQEKVIALAGVMGAKNTEVTKDSKNIFLEAAVFSPLIVRRSRRASGLDTESSYRFERRVSARNLEFASIEAADLIIKEAGGIFQGVASAGEQPYNKSKSILINVKELNDYLGSNIELIKIKKILNFLNCEVKEAKFDNLNIQTPLERFDLETKVDIYEEVARIYGFNNIAARIPSLASCLNSDLLRDKRRSLYYLKNELRRFFSLYQFKEIITFSLESRESLEKLNEKDIITILNPLRSQENALRTSLLQGMLKCQQYNLNRNKKSLPFFELANIYRHQGSRYKEETVLSLGLSGGIEDFLFLKRAIEDSLKILQIKDYKFKEEEVNSLDTSLTIFAKECKLGFLGRVDKNVCKDFDIKQDFFFAQLNLEAYMLLKQEKAYASFSPYPAISRDISIVINKGIKFRDIEKVIKEKSNYLTDLQVVDFYKGKDFGEDSTAFTLRLFYQSHENTLTSLQVDDYHNSVRETLSQIKGARLR